MRAVLCLSALLLVSVPAFAQDPNVSIVPYAGYNVDAEELFFAGGVGIPIPGAQVAGHALIVQPSFEIYPFIDGASLWAIAAHLILPFQLQATTAVVPYVMGGFSIARFSADLGVLGSISSTDPFFDFGGGVAFGASMFRTHPFVEVDVRVGDQSTLLFKGGVRIATKR